MTLLPIQYPTPSKIENPQQLNNSLEQSSKEQDMMKALLKVKNCSNNLHLHLNNHTTMLLSKQQFSKQLLRSTETQYIPIP